MAARLNSPSTIIKTKGDFNSVGRQCGHLSLWPSFPRGRLGGLPTGPPSIPLRRHLKVHPDHLVSWPVDSEEGQSAGGPARPGMSTSAVGELVSGVGPLWPLRPPSTVWTQLLHLCLPVFHMFTQTQLHPPHGQHLLKHPLSPRPVPCVLGSLLRALPTSPSSSASLVPGA